MTKMDEINVGGDQTNTIKYHSYLRARTQIDKSIAPGNTPFMVQKKN
jgi:hypothetical protein